MCAGNYDGALEIYDRLKPEFTLSDWRHISERGTVLMCLRRYGEAEAEFKLANAYSRKEDGEASQPYLESIGAAQWLTNRGEEAAETWRSEVDGLLERKIKFADLSGGVGPAMLLWFAGKSLGKPELIDKCLKLCKRQCRTSSVQYWPGPMALFALGKDDFPNLVRTQFGYSALNKLLVVADENLRIKRRLCQALFYWSLAERELGNKDYSFQLLRACVELKVPLEVEWFLARSMHEKMQ